MKRGRFEDEETDRMLREYATPEKTIGHLNVAMLKALKSIDEKGWGYNARTTVLISLKRRGAIRVLPQGGLEVTDEGRAAMKAQGDS